MEIYYHLWKFCVTGASAEGCDFQAFRGWLGLVGVVQGRSGSVGEQERSPVRSARRNRIGPNYGNSSIELWKFSVARIVPDRLWKLVALYGKKVSIIDSLWKLVVLYGNL